VVVNVDLILFLFDFTYGAQCLRGAFDRAILRSFGLEPPAQDSSIQHLEPAGVIPDGN
jgi:hypothetical protein